MQLPILTSPLSCSPVTRTSCQSLECALPSPSPGQVFIAGILFSPFLPKWIPISLQHTKHLLLPSCLTSLSGEVKASITTLHSRTAQRHKYTPVRYILGPFVLICTDAKWEKGHEAAFSLFSVGTIEQQNNRRHLSAFEGALATLCYSPGMWGSGSHRHPLVVHQNILNYANTKQAFPGDIWSGKCNSIFFSLFITFTGLFQALCSWRLSLLPADHPSIWCLFQLLK